MDLPIYLSTWLFYETSSFFQVDNIKNAALLQNFLILWSWPHQTESNSARPPPFFKLTTSKTKQFCETSFMFELNNVKNEAILRDFFILHTWQHQKQSNSATLPSKMESWVQLTASYQCVLRFFHSTCLKYCACHEKLMPGHYDVLHLSRKIILADRQIWCSKMQPLSGNQRPDRLTSPMNMSFVLRLPRKMHLWSSL